MSIQPAPDAEQVLSELAEQFEHWRRTRAAQHERIPQSLWDQAIVLSTVLPNARVAKRLRLSPTDLKKRRLAQQAPRSTQAAVPQAQFVEVTSLASGGAASSSPTEVEFERPDGARMRLQYRHSPPPLAILLQTFLEPH